MKRKGHTYFFLFFFILISTYALKAQNIDGDTIYLSRTSQTQIKFPSPIINYITLPDDDSYEVEFLDQSVLVNAKTKNAKAVTLTVKEGSREHKFILLFNKDALPETIDWSNVKKLEQHVQEIEKRRQPVVVTTTTAVKEPAAKEQPASPKPKEKPKKGGKSVQKSEEEKTAEKYNSLYDEYEKAYKAGDYNTAIAKLSEALQLRPDYTGWQTLLDEAKRKKGEKDEADYTDLFNKGVANYKENKLQEAKKNFEEAARIKPNYSLITGYLGLIERKQKEEEDRKKIEEQTAIFKEHMQAGDKAFAQQKYNEAQVSYEAALALKPSNAAAQDKLAAAKKKVTDAAYLELKDRGDAAYRIEEYDLAKSIYTEMSLMRPTDTYPRRQLTSIADKLLIAANKKAKEEEEEKRRQNYNATIVAGDKAYAAKDYEGSLLAYSNARKIAPENPYPAKMIKEINTLLFELKLEAERERERVEKEKLNQQRYTALIQTADNLLGKKEYRLAETKYTEASGLKPQEQYPKEKLAEIKLMLEQAAALERAEMARAAKERETEKKYNAAMISGKAAFAKKDWSTARKHFITASELKPDGQEHKSMIEEIDKEITKAEHNSIAEEEYKRLMTTAASAEANNDYEGAKANYKKASELLPDKLLPKQKIKEIEAAQLALVKKEEELRNKQEAERAHYQTLINNGDKSFKQEDYKKAKELYTQASALRPQEQYPKEKLAELLLINEQQAAAEKADRERLNKERELTATYNALIVKAKAAYAKEELIIARKAYADAAALKPTEEEPKSGIVLIDNRLAAIAAAQEKENEFKAAMQQAKRSEEQQVLDTALAYYQQAYTLKPAAGYLKGQIKNIQERIELKKKEELRKKYNDAIAAGRKAVSTRDWQQALAAFKEALVVRPADSEASSYIKRIEDTMEREAANDATLLRPLAEPKKNNSQQAPATKSTPEAGVTKPAVQADAGLLQSDPIPMSFDELASKYPGIDFAKPPAEQEFNAADDRNENWSVSKELFRGSAKLNLGDIAKNVKLVCQSIDFRGANAYLKFMITNNDTKEFLTGPMRLSWRKKVGSSVPLKPGSIFPESFPVVQSGKGIEVMYVTRAINVADDESLIFEMNDRLKKVRLQITIPGKIYNAEKARQPKIL